MTRCNPAPKRLADSDSPQCSATRAMNINKFYGPIPETLSDLTSNRAICPSEGRSRRQFND
jgi:hypothetical protein